MFLKVKMLPQVVHSHYLVPKTSLTRPKTPKSSLKDGPLKLRYYPEHTHILVNLNCLGSLTTVYAIKFMFWLV